MDRERERESKRQTSIANWYFSIQLNRFVSYQNDIFFCSLLLLIPPPHVLSMQSIVLTYTLSRRCPFMIPPRTAISYTDDDCLYSIIIANCYYLQTTIHSIHPLNVILLRNVFDLFWMIKRAESLSCPLNTVCMLLLLLWSHNNVLKRIPLEIE